MNARAAPPATAVEVADIVDLAHDGRGVAHGAGRTIFIDDALPGEQVEWTGRRRSGKFDEGRLHRVLRASPDRVEPRCAHFGYCGGCVLQHCSAERQVEFKQQQLIEALARIGHVAPALVLPPLRAGAWHYRRRARLAAKWVAKKNRTVVGFRERATPYIADLQRCEVLRAPAADLPQALSALISQLSIRDRVPQVELAIGDNATALVVRILQPLTEADRDLLRSFGHERGLQIWLQPGGYDTVAPLDPGHDPLFYRLPQFDLELQFLPTDFVQINGELNEQMVSRAVEMLKLQPADRVLDLFCGLGNFSLPLARRAAHVVGVEGEAGLIARAGENAQRNGIANAEFFVANLADEKFAAAAWASRRYDKVLLDPPRAGAREVLPAVAACGARRIVYISCHPGSLARDAGILVQEHGFALIAAGVMDMFPHTAHVESVAVFDRSG